MKHWRRDVRKFGWLIALFAVLALTAWACGGGDDDDGGGGGGDSDNISDACDDGDLPGGLPGEVSDDVPDDFPDDFPIYDGADFLCGYSGESEGTTGSAGIWRTGDSLEDVQAFYEEELGGDGPWTSPGSGSSGGSSFWTVTKGDGGEGGVVTLTSEGDDTVITIIVGEDLGDVPSGDDDSSSGDDDGDDEASGDGDEPASDPSDDPSDEGGDDGSGSADLPDEVELPDDFPSDDVDLPDGRVTAASSFTSGGVQSWVIEVVSTDSVEDLAAHFRDSFEAKGWAQSFQTETQGLISAAYTENADATGMVVSMTIGESPYEGYNSVNLSVVAN
jgi:hypothetical protein